MPLNQMSPGCPGCGAWITRVVMTIPDSECFDVVRRRHCKHCDHRFYTRQRREEIVDVRWLPRYKGKSIPEITKVYKVTNKTRRVA